MVILRKYLFREFLGRVRVENRKCFMRGKCIISTCITFQYFSRANDLCVNDRKAWINLRFFVKYVIRFLWKKIGTCESWITTPPPPRTRRSRCWPTFYHPVRNTFQLLHSDFTCLLYNEVKCRSILRKGIDIEILFRVSNTNFVILFIVKRLRILNTIFSFTYYRNVE